MTNTSDNSSNSQVQTGGGTYVEHDVNVGGNFVGRDNIAAERDIIIHNYQAPIFAPDAKTQVYVNVPTMPSHFIGREKPIDTIVGKVLSKSQQRLSLQGLPGVGKTTLAVAVTHHPDILRGFQDGILWGGLGQRPDVMGILATWAQELGRDITGVAHVEERTKAVKATIGQRYLLLVIDDAWDLEPAQLLSCGGPNCVHLLTTRSQTIGRSFATGSQTETLSTLDDDTAYVLLQKLAPEACDADQDTARKLIGRLGGLPLAIELLGGYLAIPEHSAFPELSKEALAELNDPRRRLQLAQKRLDSTTGKEETLQETIALSLDGLSLDEVRAFYALGAFAPKPQWFDREAATFVMQTTLSTLAKLMARNLVEKLQGNRLTLHQIIADMAHSQMEPAAVERHYHFYLNWVSTNSNNWQQIEQIYDQVKWAWDSTPDSKMLYDLMKTMYAFQNRRGLWNDVIQWANRGLRLAEQQEWQDEVVLCLRFLSRAYEAQYRWEDALQVCEERLNICRKLGRRKGEAGTLHALGNIYNWMGQWDEALKQYGADLAIWQELNDPQGEGRALNNIGNIYRKQERWSEALQCYEKSLYLKRATNDRDGEDITIFNIGKTHSQQGNWEVTIQMYKEHLRFRQEQGANDSVLFLLKEIAETYRSNELWEEAIAKYIEGLRLCRELGDRDAEGRILNNLGTVYEQQKRWEDAIQVYSESRRIQQEIGNHHIEGITLRNLGNVYNALGKQEKALAFWQEALSKLRWDSSQYKELIEKSQEASIDG